MPGSLLTISGVPVTINGENIVMSIVTLRKDVPAVCIAIETIDFAEIGVNIMAKSIIKIQKSPLAYKSDRTINALDKFEKGSGYLIVSKEDADMSDIIITSS